MAKSSTTQPSPEKKVAALTIRRLPIAKLRPHPKNPRIHPAPGSPEWNTLRASLAHDYFDPVVWNERNGMLVSGHLRSKVMAAEGVTHADCVIVDYDDITHIARMIAANKNIGKDDDNVMQQLLTDLSQTGDIAMDITGFTGLELDNYFKALAPEPAPGDANKAQKCLANGVLVKRFGVPPFSVLDSKQGYWQERKQAWLSLGIMSELGRDATCNPSTIRGDYGRSETNKTNHGVSIFDPVLCELAYRWFCPKGGEIGDMFAGGAVRGIVAGWLGYKYTGIELRPDQVAANYAQAKEILSDDGWPTDDFTGEFTPIEEHGGFMVKRDDAFQVAGVRGGKVRSCYALALKAKAEGKAGLTTAGSRSSPQVNIVSHIAQRLGMKCVIHTPKGELSPEVQDAVNCGAEIIQHKAGYNSVIVARAAAYAAEKNFADIPFGMECGEAVEQTRKQVANLPKETKRIVMPVGSGMSLAGVLWGLRDCGLSIPVLGVVVGADCEKRLDEYAPEGWRGMVKLVPAGLDYHDAAPVTVLGDLQLDPIYEAKCLKFLEAGDLLWVVGIRATIVPQTREQPKWLTGDSRNVAKLTAKAQFDLLFTCPPYFDLEVYSDLPGDISNAADYASFLAVYREIIAKSVQQLKDNRFAVIVVGEIRDKNGFNCGFVNDTINAYVDAGMKYYNEAVLLTSIGTLPVRAGRQFASGRKLGKAHQQMLVFYKGDPEQIKTDFPVPEMGDLPEVDETPVTV